MIFSHLEATKPISEVALIGLKILWPLVVCDCTMNFLWHYTERLQKASMHSNTMPVLWNTWSFITVIYNVSQFYFFGSSEWILRSLCETRRVIINNHKGCNGIKLKKRVVFGTVVFTTFSIIKEIPPISDVFYDTKFLKKIPTFE